LQQVGIYEDQPFESYFSGNTVQICPVGALTGAAYRFRPPLRSGFDPGCLRALRERVRDPHRPPPRHRPTPDGDQRSRAVNEEWNCDKGRWAFAAPTVGDRISLPLVRGASGEPRGDLVARGAGRRRGRTAGPACRGADRWPGQRRGRLRLRKFARTVLGTNAIDFRARPHSADEARFLASTVVATGPRAAA
jgi:NADH-quinone oxidoreductase subunit G